MKPTASTPRIGYLLPTRERIMEGRNETASLLALAERAEGLGFDSIWIGDSLTARPRHEPMALMAAVAARTKRVQMGTAVMLPALRNPVLLAHQAATIDQISEGRLILGVGIASDVANIRQEFASCGVPFEQRGARMMELIRLCRALWTGEPVSWEGRWTLSDQKIGPLPFRKGGPPIWLAGSKPLALKRIATQLDGWFPNDSDPARWATVRAEIDAQARAAGRDPAGITGAAYLTMAIDDNAARADERLNAYLESYYNQPAAALRARQVCYGGPAAGAGEWLASYARAGVSHMCLRFAGDHERQQDIVSRIKSDLGWN